MENDSKITFSLNEAKKFFHEHNYSCAEPLLNRLILNNVKKPEIFHMLATIFSEKGQFSKAIRSFERSLEIDSGFTEASIGLSVLYNDLGQYEKGRKVFTDAKALSAHKNTETTQKIKENIANLHEQAAQLYTSLNKHKESLLELKRALRLSTRKPEITLKIIDTCLMMKNHKTALSLLIALCKEFPSFITARLRLGKLYYDGQNITQAISHWEYALKLDAHNAQAQEYLRLAHSLDHIEANTLGLQTSMEDINNA